MSTGETWRPPVPDQEPNWEEIGQQVLQQAFDIWVNPEIERRRGRGVIRGPFTVRGAQVIFDPGAGAPLVRLNEEVKAVLRGRATRPIKKGELIGEDDITPETIILTSEDPNAGHITVLSYKDKWLISFDFRRNAARIEETVAAAHDFIDSATDALEHNRWRSFSELLFAAVELTAKGELMMHPDRKLLDGRHGYLQGQYNLWGKLGHTNPRYARLLKGLAELRPATRYLQKVFSLSEPQAREMLETAREALARLEAITPRRYPVERIREVFKAPAEEVLPSTDQG